MSYKISSDQFSHPLLKPILKDLSALFQETGIKFFVIGATARDLIMEIHNEASGRLTHDLDIAIAIDKWDQFTQVEESLVATDRFTKDKKQKQRFYYLDKYMLDIVPFGDIMKHTDKIFWPPEEDIAMTVLGFNEVHEHTQQIDIDDEISIQVATLAGIFILKLIAWKDRHLASTKDAEDIGFILNNYLNINLERATDHYEEIYDDDFTELRGSGILIGKDIHQILPENSNARAGIIQQLEEQIEQAEESKLLNQIIETNKLFKYDDLFGSLTNILKELKRL